MIRPLLLVAGALALTAPLLAAPHDPRLVSRLYNADEVVRIEGHANVQATIAFDADEHIENVAVGDANSWQITPNKRANLLFVKPLAPRARTNMTVVTDQRTYLFDLVATPTATPLYVLRFTYPEAPRTKATPKAADASLNAEESQTLAGKPLVDPATLNFAWNPRGSAHLFPSRIYDDGEATYVSWAAGRPVPALLVRDETGMEGPVNYAVRDDVLVIDGVPQALILRAGRASAVIENRGKAPKPTALATAETRPKGQ